jgi:hypothetical protein
MGQLNVPIIKSGDFDDARVKALLTASRRDARELAARPCIRARLKERGYRFITLDAAMSDAAYQTRDTFVTKAGPTWLWRWTRSLGLAVSFRDDPEPPKWIMDLYSAGAAR